MVGDERLKRLSSLAKIPPIAARDHRRLLDANGKLPMIQNLSRKERRKLDAGSRKIAKSYRDIIKKMMSSGAGFPIDQQLFEFAIEYTHRYASSGVENQPISFEYVEPFCEIKLIDGTVAPFAIPRGELGLVEYQRALMIAAAA